MTEELTACLEDELGDAILEECSRAVCVVREDNFEVAFLQQLRILCHLYRPNEDIWSNLSHLCCRKQ